MCSVQTMAKSSAWASSRDIYIYCIESGFSHTKSPHIKRCIAGRKLKKKRKQRGKRKREKYVRIGHMRWNKSRLIDSRADNSDSSARFHFLFRAVRRCRKSPVACVLVFENIKHRRGEVACVSSEEVITILLSLTRDRERERGTRVRRAGNLIKRLDWDRPAECCFSRVSLHIRRSRLVKVRTI